MTASLAAYGPINKTTFSETADGTVIRRMPNLVKFREDPDAMLVMALEDYDEVTGKAAKAPILLRDVVGKSPPVTSVASAEEGLLVSLDRTGGIDLAYISRLYGKPEDAIIAELGDLIYRDPETQNLADRRRIPVRQRAGETGRGRVQRARPTPATPRHCGRCSPKTCCPATSTPASVPRGYRKPTSRRSPPNCSASPLGRQIGHLKKDAVWSVDAGHAAEASVAATAEYGTPRANGTWLLDLALNMKTPVIYDTIQGVNGEERVVNQEATLAAREKQKLIKERFKSWVFAEPERTERLVRLYNDTYNNLRPRLFDGSPPRFPRHEPGHHAQPAPGGRRLAGHEQRQHAAGPRRRGRQDLHDGRHRHEDEAGRAEQEADVRRAQPHARAIRPRIHAALPQRQAAGRHQGGSGPRPPQAADRQDRQRRVGRHHRHPQQLRADRHVEGLPGAFPPRADRRIRPVAPRQRRRQTRHRNIIKTIEKAEGPPRGAAERPGWPRTRKTTGWCSTSWASITSSSMSPIISRTWRRRPRWSVSPASRPAAASGPSTST